MLARVGFGTCVEVLMCEHGFTKRGGGGTDERACVCTRGGYACVRMCCGHVWKPLLSITEIVPPDQDRRSLILMLLASLF